MEEMIQQVIAKTGIDATKAKTAVETVLNLIKSKLPEPLAAQLDGLLGGGGNPTDLLGKLGGMFGGPKA